MTGVRTVRCILAAAAILATATGFASETIDETVRREARDVRRHWIGLWRARLSNPQRVSAGLGFIVADVPGDYPCTSPCEYRGPVVQIEPGLTGAQLGVGWAIVVGEGGRERPFLSAVHVGFGVKGCLLRTWNDPAGFPDHASLAGIEGSATVSRANVSIGVYRDLGGASAGRRYRFALGLGYGF